MQILLPAEERHERARLCSERWRASGVILGFSLRLCENSLARSGRARILFVVFVSGPLSPELEHQDGGYPDNHRQVQQ